VRGILRVGLVSLVLLACAGTAVAVSGTPAVAGDQAVAYQIGRTHRGFQTDALLAPPLTQRWTTTFDSSVSYPLIAEGKVFVTVRNVSQYGTKLYALDQATGKSVWARAIAGTYYWSNAAYNDGAVFVLNFDGVLTAFSAADGTRLWKTQLPGQYAFSSPPVASSGVVYTGGAGSGGTLYAVDQTTGQVLWTRSVENGDHSSPAVSSDKVFASYVGPQVYAFDRASGAPLWHYDSGTEGGGGRTPVLAAGRLWVRDPVSTGYVFDAQTGKLLDNFASATAPAFAGRTGLFLDGRELEAREVPGGKLLWSFAGDGQLASAPIVVQSGTSTDVFVGSTTGELYALNLLDGSVDWSTNVGSPIPGPDEQNVSQPLTGLGAGQGLLVVPAGNVLAVYGQ
jgi:outer membrane protein assembly factor BamB